MKSELLDSSAHGTVQHKRIVDSEMTSSFQVKGDLPSTACSKKPKPQYLKKKNKAAAQQGKPEKLQKKKST